MPISLPGKEGSLIYWLLEINVKLLDFIGLDALNACNFKTKPVSLGLFELTIIVPLLNVLCLCCLV